MREYDYRSNLYITYALKHQWILHGYNRIFGPWLHANLFRFLACRFLANLSLRKRCAEAQCCDVNCGDSWRPRLTGFFYRYPPLLQREREPHPKVSPVHMGTTLFPAMGWNGWPLWYLWQASVPRQCSKEVIESNAQCKLIHHPRNTSQTRTQCSLGAKETTVKGKSLPSNISRIEQL